MGAEAYTVQMPYWEVVVLSRKLVLITVSYVITDLLMCQCVQVLLYVLILAPSWVKISVRNAGEKISVLAILSTMFLG